MRYLQCYRSAAVTLLLASLTASACQSEDEAGMAMTTAASTPGDGSTGLDADNPCAIPSASAEHVAQVLGTGKLTGPTLLETASTQKCQFAGADDIGDTVAIEFILDASSLDFDSARRAVDSYLGDTTDVPDFGDQAFSAVTTTDLGSSTLVINTLCVLKGDVLVIISSKAPFEQIRALETDVLRDFGA